MTRDQLRRAWCRGDAIKVIAAQLGITPEATRQRCLRWFGPRHPGTVQRAQHDRRMTRLRDYWLTKAA